MRKPYRWRRGPLPVFDSDLIKDRPEWAAKIGELTAHWNVLEASTSALFMVLLAGEDQGAFFIYYDVLKDPKRATREKIFTAIGESRRLPEWLLKQIMDLWDRVAAVESLRNEVVHAIWATIDGHDDALFVVKDRFEWLRNANAAMTCNLARNRGKSTYIVPTDLPTATEFYKYTLADLQEIVNDLLTLNADSQHLQRRLANRIFRFPVIPPEQKAESIIRHVDRENEARRTAAAELPPGQRPRLPEQPPAEYEDK